MNASYNWVDLFRSVQFSLCAAYKPRFSSSSSSSGGMAHKNNRQITIDNTSKYRKTDRHIVDNENGQTETI